jgi:hypothetical protein
VVSEVLVDIGSLGTAAGVIVTASQLWINRRQARTQFEDGLTARYRDLVRELPIGAFLDGEMETDELRAALGVFYRYFDLCNEQAFLHEEGRVSHASWEQWRDGIESNMRRPAFRTAWLREIQPRIGDNFDEFRRVLDSLKDWPSLPTNEDVQVASVPPS